MSQRFHLHLLSDSTGETLNAMARAVCARFENVLPIEHIYALVRSSKQMERVLEEVASVPGVVLHTLVYRELRAQRQAHDQDDVGNDQHEPQGQLLGAKERHAGLAVGWAGERVRTGEDRLSTLCGCTAT